MTDDQSSRRSYRTRQLLRQGEGYWCYEKVKPRDDPLAAFESIGPDEPMPAPAPIETVTLYRPVIVEEAGDEVVAYYYDPDATGLEVAKNGGKKYVPIEQVFTVPLRDAEPAYRYEQPE